MCICVDCSWVNRCKTYHKVETQHGAEHLTQSPDFDGNNPRIHVSLSNISAENGIGIEWDVQSCESFKEDKGKWLRLCPDKELPT